MSQGLIERALKPQRGQATTVRLAEDSSFLGGLIERSPDPGMARHRRGAYGRRNAPVRILCNGSPHDDAQILDASIAGADLVVRQRGNEDDSYLFDGLVVDPHLAGGDDEELANVVMMDRVSLAGAVLDVLHSWHARG